VDAVVLSACAPRRARMELVATFQPTAVVTEAQRTTAAQTLVNALRTTTLLVGVAASLAPHAVSTDWAQLLHPTGYLVEVELEFVTMPQYTVNSADLMLSLREDLAQAMAVTVALPRAWVATNHSACALDHADVGGGPLGVRVRVTVAFPRSGASVANAFATALALDATELLTPAASPELRSLLPAHATWVLTRRAHQPPPAYRVRVGCCGQVEARLDLSNLTTDVVQGLLLPSSDGAEPLLATQLRAQLRDALHDASGAAEAPTVTLSEVSAEEGGGEGGGTLSVNVLASFAAGEGRQMDSFAQRLRSTPAALVADAAMVASGDVTTQAAWVLSTAPFDYRAPPPQPPSPPSPPPPVVPVPLLDIAAVVAAPSRSEVRDAAAVAKPPTYATRATVR